MHCDGSAATAATNATQQRFSGGCKRFCGRTPPLVCIALALRSQMRLKLRARLQLKSSRAGGFAAVLSCRAHAASSAAAAAATVTRIGAQRQSGSACFTPIHRLPQTARQRITDNSQRRQSNERMCYFITCCMKYRSYAA